MRNIAKKFKITMSLIDIETIKPRYKCFFGEDVELCIKVIDEDARPVDLTDVNAKVYYTCDKFEPLRQDNDITINEPTRNGTINILVNKKYLRLGVNTIRVALFDSDQEVLLQPCQVNCIETGIGDEHGDVIVNDDINVKDEFIKTNNKINGVDGRLKVIEGNIPEIKSGIADVNSQLNIFKSETNNKVSIVDNRLKAVERNVPEIENRLADVSERLDNIVKISLNDYEGTTDEKFAQLINDVETNHLTSYMNIIIPNGIHEISKELTFNGWKNKIIDIIGVIRTNNKCNAITFKRCSSNKITINAIQGNTSISTNELNTLEYDCIKFLNSEMNYLYINNIYGFRNGISLLGENFNDNKSYGTFGNNIDYRVINRCFKGIFIDDDNNGGWVNENVVNGGGLWCYHGVYSGNANNDYHDTSRFHSNKFYNIEFEQIYGGSAIFLYNAHSYIFENPRFEGGGNPIEQKIIYESENCRNNVYSTSRYLMHLEQIKLSTTGQAGSVVIGDIRYKNNPIANKIESVRDVGLVFDFKLSSIPDYLRTSIQQKTLIKYYNDKYLFSYTDSLGETINLLHFEKPNIVSDEMLLNNFTNFDNSGTTRGKFNYYKQNQRVYIEGWIKGGTDNSIIFKLPTDYLSSKTGKVMFPCVAQDSSGYKTVYVEIDCKTGEITFKSSVSGLYWICISNISFNI